MKIKFDTNNAAFVEYEYPQSEIARVLRKIADEVEHRKKSGNIRDINGNSIGSWEV